MEFKAHVYTFESGRQRLYRGGEMSLCLKRLEDWPCNDYQSRTITYGTSVPGMYMLACTSAPVGRTGPSLPEGLKCLGVTHWMSHDGPRSVMFQAQISIKVCIYL